MEEARSPWKKRLSPPKRQVENLSPLRAWVRQNTAVVGCNDTLKCRSGKSDDLMERLAAFPVRLSYTLKEKNVQKISRHAKEK